MEYAHKNACDISSHYNKQLYNDTIFRLVCMSKKLLTSEMTSREMNQNC